MSEEELNQARAEQELSLEELKNISGAGIGSAIRKWRIGRMEKHAKKLGLVSSDGQINWMVNNKGGESTDHHQPDDDISDDDPSKLF